mgnify:CR=1 FL=1
MPPFDRTFVMSSVFGLKSTISDQSIPPPPRGGGIPYPKDNGIQIKQEHLRLPKIALPPLLKEDLKPADKSRFWTGKPHEANGTGLFRYVADGSR